MFLGLPSVVLKSRLSQFWRHQADSPRWYLATVEAIHQFLVELDAVQWKCNRRTGLDINITNRLISESILSEDVGKQGVEEQSEDKQVNEPGAKTIGEEHEGDTSSTDNQLLSEYCYTGQYDNLLFFFRFMYCMIHMLYDHDKLKSYKRRLE